MKILNLYAGIGGNRQEWGGHEITAVEWDKNILEVYGEIYPNDKLICGDAIEYLENNYKEYDFIWASPPCVTHSRIRKMGVDRKVGTYNAVVPDLRLYGIIIFLDNHFDGFWCVENVIPYYDCLIKPIVELGRHYFWSNFNIPEMIGFERPTMFRIDGQKSKDLKEYEMYKYLENKKGIVKETVLRNCVNKEIGKYILECVTKTFTEINLKTPLFEE